MRWTARPSGPRSAVWSACPAAFIQKPLNDAADDRHRNVRRNFDPANCARQHEVNGAIAGFFVALERLEDSSRIQPVDSRQWADRGHRSLNSIPILFAETA